MFVTTLSNQEDVESLLCNVREAIDKGRFIPVCRSKNLKTLAELGIMWHVVKDEVYSLTYDDYKKGPEIDRDDPSTDCFWIFKKIILGQLIYIKLKVLY
ncbi:hypothetical protein, partial [Ethanoligenens sp.]|uniref:hypothetical protein n=1 Tax=Ethanoligenens sp. TaxID=2099655 RepID=UPI0039ECB986